MNKFWILEKILFIIEVVIACIWIIDASVTVNTTFPYEPTLALLGIISFSIYLKKKDKNLNIIKDESKISKNQHINVKVKTESKTLKNQDKNDKLKSVDNPYFINFLSVLPENKRNIYIEAQKKFHTGITVEMRDGASFIIDFLVDSWIQISDFYDNDIFNNELPKDYIDKFIKNRYRFHWAKYLPEGGNGIGTMYGVVVVVDAEVISDVEREILSLINAIGMVSDKIDTCKIIEEWKEI